MTRLSFIFIWFVLAGGSFGADGAVQSAGGLSFEKTRFEHNVDPSLESIVAKFNFKNSTGKTVTIQDVHTNCGCIRADTDKKVYEPGESGVVEAEFKVGSLEGVVEKTVTVQTDSKQKRLQTLTVVMNIPTLIEIKPDLTEWLVGSDPEPKEVIITVKHDKPIRVLSTTCSRANVKHQILTVEEGRIYKVLLTPQTTEKLMLGVLRIKTDAEIKKYQNRMAFFGVVKSKRNRS